MIGADFETCTGRHVFFRGVMYWTWWLSLGFLACARLGLCDIDPYKGLYGPWGNNDPNGVHDQHRYRKVKTTRTYYIAAIEVDWDYAPNGNLIGERAEPFAEKFFAVGRNPLRLGKVYKKSIYREFTDSTFTVMKRREPWQGILGPTIRGEVGDLAIVHFFNNVSEFISMHPHGARYVKQHEGALYEDDTYNELKMDDMVPPGGFHTYNWFFIPEDGPTKTDPDCLTWMYHSHRNADTDIHAGLLGPLIVCRPGTLDHTDRPKTVDRSFALSFLIFDENDSFYVEENIRRIAPDISKREIKKLLRDTDFRNSNRMFSVNGLSFGNLQGLDMCLGEKIGWHIVGMGNEVDVHSISFESQIFTVNGKTLDVISLFPAKFTTDLMIASRVGTFPFRCEVGQHRNAGMESTFTVNQCPHSRRVEPKLSGVVRQYFIAAEEIIWNYAPTGINWFNSMPLTEDEAGSTFFIRNGTRIGGEYRKAVYREYLDPGFKKRKPRTYEDAHLGLLGPTMRAEVGDEIHVTFLNKASRPYNMHTHGASHAVDNDPVMPGDMKQYIWVVAEQYGPTPSDAQCITFRYYSTVDVARDFWDGLDGTLLTCKKGSLNSKGKQKNVDREFSLMYAVIDESQTHFIRDNIQTYTLMPHLVNMSDAGFVESNQMHSINGRVFGNLEGLNMCLGETISWHIFTFGRGIDLHTAYFHGQTFQTGGRFRDTLAVAPSTHHTVVMYADNPGDWPLDCRTNDHFANGMRAIFRVEDCGKTAILPHEEFITAPKKIREYFIAAVEEDWNYAPIDRHIIDGSPLEQNKDSREYVRRGPDRIGRIYKKAMYREFTDATFVVQKQRSPAEQHLEIMGPYIKAEVGEVIRVVFKNMASRPYNIHPHGVLLEKSVDESDMSHVENEQAPVYPGETTIYEWPVPERAGPGRTGFNCTSWAYYSSVNVVRDTNAGLIGPLITCKPGILSESNRRVDVYHEFAVLFTIFDENQSWYLQDNIVRFTTNPASVKVNDPDFVESNRMHAVNGRLYGSLQGLVAQRDTIASWYMMGMGTEVDMHTAHFHGQTFLRRTDSIRRADVVYLFPGVFETIEMVMDNPGTWFLHCHVDDHMRAGMSAVYTVER